MPIPEHIQQLPGWLTQQDCTPVAPLPKHPPAQPVEVVPQSVVHNHYYAPKRRLSPGDVMGWVAVLGVVSGVLVALAFAAVAVGIAALAVAILALVFRKVWNDSRGGGRT